MQEQLKVNVYGGFGIRLQGYAFIEAYPSFILVSTGSEIGTVPLTVKVVEAQLAEPLDDWDHVVECSLALVSSDIVIVGDDGADYDTPGDYHTISVMAGNYRMRIYYGGLNTAKHDGGFRKGQDFYQITLWPEEEHHEPTVMKQYPRR